MYRYEEGHMRKELDRQTRQAASDITSITYRFATGFDAEGNGVADAIRDALTLTHVDLRVTDFDWEFSETDEVSVNVKVER